MYFSIELNHGKTVFLAHFMQLLDGLVDPGRVICCVVCVLKDCVTGSNVCVCGCEKLWQIHDALTLLTIQVIPPYLLVYTP